MKTILRAAALPLALSLPFAGSPAAQVPPGHAVRHSFDGPGIELIDVHGDGSVTVVPGYPSDLNGGTIDPATGELVLGGLAGVMTRSLLAGSTMATFDLVGVLPPLALKTVQLDGAGDYWTCNNVEVWRIERHTGVQTLWDADVGFDTYPGLFNSQEIDVEGERMWVATSRLFSTDGAVLLEYDLTAGPGPGTVVADFLSVPGSTGFTNGLAYDGDRTLYVSLAQAGPKLLAYDVESGALAAVPFPPNDKLSAIAWDRRKGVLHAIGLDGYYLVDPASSGVTKVLSGPTSTGIGVPSGVAMNDALDLTTVFPRRPSVAAPFLLEAAAHGEAGEPAGIAIVGVNGATLATPLVLAAGVTDSGGLLPFAAFADPAGLAPGDRFTVQSARVASTGAVVLGDAVDVVMQP